MKRRAHRGNFFLNKKGVELTLNTVIISILVVLVLVVIIGFFLGGTTKMKDVASTIFNTGTAGVDISVAVEQCTNYCKQAQGWSEDLQQSSPWCKQTFNLDTQGRGDADKHTNGEYKAYKCGGQQLNIPCTPKINCLAQDTQDN